MPRTTPNGPAVSLLIATTARDDRIDALLDRAMEAQLALGDLGEVLLIDNSREGRLSRARRSGVRIIPSPLPGLSRARTAGCLQARGQVLVFTDDDVEFDAAWPMRMAEPILRGRCWATAAPVRLHEEFNDVTGRRDREWLAEANLDSQTRARLVGAGMAVHRALLGIGLWDPRLGAGVPVTSFGEETLFQEMIEEAGATVEVCRDAPVTHQPDRSRVSGENWRRTADAKGRSEAYVAYHWFGADLRHARLRVVRRRLRLLVHRVLNGRGGSFEHELGIIQSIAFAEGFVHMRREPRAYLPRAAPLALPLSPPPTPFERSE